MSLTSSTAIAEKPPAPPTFRRPTGRPRFVLMLAGFVVLWAVMDRTAAALGSTRGEGGFWVFGLVLLVAVVIEYVLSGPTLRGSLAALGFRRPNRRAVVTTLALLAALLAFYPLFALSTGTTVSLLPGAAGLAIGIFLQGGLAEEMVFRGFLFRRFRENRTFWRAALLSSVPFVAVHCLLFLALDPAIAALSILVAVSMSFPLALLFERSGNSIWMPALLHAVIQGSIKLVDAGEGTQTMAVAWMGLAITTPWLLFLFLRQQPPREPAEQA